jgi:hypothetical protein
MATIYKIHPAIGVARVGNSPDAFFVGPEAPGSPGVEIGADGTETTLMRYKHDGRVKRQAARFRVFAYEQDASGSVELVGEVGVDARVEWTVDLVNRKAALDRQESPAQPRNVDIADRTSLIIGGAAPATITGPCRPAREINGKFLGKQVYLGELRTDADGHLIVLGGRGISGSVPANQPLRNFANNNRWHDDVSDGPVSAVVTLPGQVPVVVHEPAWVVVAPPDFAPTVDPIVSLYEIAYQAAIDKGALQPVDQPAFTRHIKPMIARMVDMRWVDDFQEWNVLLPLDWDVLSDPSPGAAAARKRIADLLQDPGLADFRLPDHLQRYVIQWADGDFINDHDGPPPAPEPLPQQLDLAALGHCSGNNFYPGIEGGHNLTDRDIYARPFRLDRTNAGKVYPGCLTEIMAVPWQADFLACEGNWWPTQRPDVVMTGANDVPGSAANWRVPIPDFKGMVDNAMRLGFVVKTRSGGQTVQAESERDPGFPRTGA